MSRWRLLADIGGTNARFARSTRTEEISQPRSYDVARFADFEAALDAYLGETGGSAGCGEAAIAAAGPVVGRQVQLTNAAWRLSEAEISQRLGDVPVGLLNDLEAVALALPHLEAADVKSIGEVRAVPAQKGRLLAVNVGTGFGAAVAMPLADGWTSSPSEAGHMSFGAQDEEELALLAGGEGTWSTVEDVLSGPGLLALYRRQCARLGSKPAAADASEVLTRANTEAAARETLALFSRWLGRAARDLALASAAWGGVFLTGGVIQGWYRLDHAGLFRASFEAGGKMQARLKETPTAAITRADVSFLGLARSPVG